MSILLVGANGNMGARYQAVLRHLGQPFEGVDRFHSPKSIREIADVSQGVIICTPTDTHLEYLQLFSDLRKPVLCEKPLCKDPQALAPVIAEYGHTRTPINMIFQYEELAPPMPAYGESTYNYFKHGTDGLVWDCIQIIALASGEIILEESSPIWTCQINGHSLRLSDMDQAYISHIAQWLKNPGQDTGWLMNVHFKTKEIENYSRGTHEPRH